MTMICINNLKGSAIAAMFSLCIYQAGLLALHILMGDTIVDLLPQMAILLGIKI